MEVLMCRNNLDTTTTTTTTTITITITTTTTTTRTSSYFRISVFRTHNEAVNYLLQHK